MYRSINLTPVLLNLLLNMKIKKKDANIVNILKKFFLLIFIKKIKGNNVKLT